MSGSGRLAEIGKRIETSGNAAMNFYAGGAGLEALTPQRDSFYNVLPELVGYEDNPVTNFYNTAGRWTQAGMDVGASLGLDLFIDTALGATKFAKDSFAKKFFGRDEFASYQYKPKVQDGAINPEGGTYVMKDTPTFTHEIRTFYHQIANDLSAKPISEVGGAMAADATKTLDGFTKQFTDNLSPIASGIKSDIRENILSLRTRS